MSSLLNGNGRLLNLAEGPREPAASYAAALIVGRLADRDIVDLARRGFAVRPFLELEPGLTSMFLGQSADIANPTHSPPRQAQPPVSAVPERTYDGEFASQVCKHLDPSLPNTTVREFFHLCAAKTRKRLTVRQASEAIGIERPKLGALLEENGCPGADDVIRWMRLLHAAWLLSRTPKRSVEDVAKALAFASGPSMSNTMKNIIGVRPSELAERGGYNLVLAQFRRMLNGANPDKAHPENTDTAP